MNRNILISLLVVAIVAAVGALYVVTYRPALKSNMPTIQPQGISDQRTGEPSQPEASRPETIDKSTEFYAIHAEIPIEAWDKKDEMRQFVYQQIQQREEDWKIGGVAYEEEQRITKDFPDRPKMTYSLNINYSRIVSEKRETVSYVLLIGTYTGGANGSEAVQTFVFNKNGKVDLESVLDISGETMVNGKKIPNDIALSQMLLEKAKMDTEHFPIADMVSQGLGLSNLASDGMTLDRKKCQCDGYFFGSNLQNFVLTDEGIEFHFGKGSITAGAAGSVHILLDWDQLKPYEASAQAASSLPSGYTLKHFTVAETLNASCKVNADCKTPAEYLVRSNCPYTSLCLQYQCTVVCPDKE